jgi:hypothetical protein
MTRLQQRAAALERERGLQRLRRWTTACVVGAAGLVGVFAVLAAGSFPGRATAGDSRGGATFGGATSGAQPSDGSAAPSQPSDQSPGQSPDQPAAPGGGYFGSGAGGRQGFATSGGS